MLLEYTNWFGLISGYKKALASGLLSIQLHSSCWRIDSGDETVSTIPMTLTPDNWHLTSRQPYKPAFCRENYSLWSEYVSMKSTARYV